MQKLVNLMALVGFLGTATIVGAGTYVYMQRDVLIESAIDAATAAATEAVVDALPGMVEGLMPEIPELPGATGGVMPELPSATGGVMPF